MRDQWYGDHRDLVKWGVLLEIARSRGCEHILQVLYYRPSTWGDLEIDRQKVELGTEAIRHFRTATSIANMNCDVSIETIEDEFRDRDEYHKLILERIKTREKTRGIILLDPDTGLEPKGRAGLQHVLNKELKEIWESLSIGDVLVLYQHKTGKNIAPWIPIKMKQFSEALGDINAQAKLAHAPRIANDVAFFFAEKN